MHTSLMLAAALPDLDSLDLEAMKALVIAQHERYSRTLISRTTEIERLTLLVEKLKYMLFGRKSEKVLRQIEQLEFQIEDLVTATAIEEAQSVAPPATCCNSEAISPTLARASSARDPYPHARSCVVSRLRELGEDVAEMLECIRSSLGSGRVTRVLERVIAERGRPENVRSDNGPEFTSRRMIGWAEDWKVGLVTSSRADRCRTDTSKASMAGCATSASTQPGSGR